MELAPALGWRASMARRPAGHPRRASLAPYRRFSTPIKALPSDEDLSHAPGSLFNAGKDPHRMVEDTTDEESNLPENPLNLDEDIMVPQRPGIDAVYRDATGRWALQHSDTSPLVGDTTDEDSVRPDDPLDMDDDLINVPQRPFAADIYESLPGHPHAPRRHPRDVAASAEPKKSDAKQRHVASGLPPPDPTAPMAPSLSTGDEELADEVADELRFEGVGAAVREAREESARGGEGKSASGLPPTDPNASSVASLDSDDEKVADELASMFRFEGAGQAAREAREEHRRHETEHGAHTAGSGESKDFPEKGSNRGNDPIPGSHEAPEVAPPGTGDRKRRMEQAEQDATEMGGSGHSAAHTDPRPRDRLPGLITEDTTFLHPEDAEETDESDAIEGGQSDREERLQGLMEGIQKIEEDEKRRHDPLHPDLHDALLGGGGRSSDAVDASLAAMEGDEEEEGRAAPGGGPGIAGSDPHDWPEGDPDGPAAATGLGDAPTPLPEVSFEFKSEKGDRSSAVSKSRSLQALSHGAQVLRALAAKAAAAGAERSEDPLARLSAAREASKAHHEAASEALRRHSPNVTASRVVEIAAGRAATVGLGAAAITELLLRQSVMSQLLGRWEGPLLAESAVPGARTAAVAVLAVSLVAAATEALLAQGGPPAFRLAGLTPRAQLWTVRAAMLVFTSLVVWEVAHSNHPALPTFFLW